MTELTIKDYQLIAREYEKYEGKIEAVMKGEDKTPLVVILTDLVHEINILEHKKKDPLITVMSMAVEILTREELGQLNTLLSKLDQKDK